MNLTQKIASQKPVWIVVEGVIVLILLVGAVVFAFSNLNTIQEEEATYQAYGDRTSRAEWGQID